MKRFYTLLVCSLILSSCSQEVTYNWDEKSRINTYSNWITGDICQDIVDNLDFLFQASAYRDTLRNGGDVQVVIDRQFSNPHFSSPKVNEDGEICWYQMGNENAAEFTITHNNISLDEDGALWVAHGRMKRFWNAYQQPSTEYCEWSVRRENGEYTLSGGMIHNGFKQQYFTMSNFYDIKFTTSVVEVPIWSATNGDGRKQTLRYSFSGDLMAVAAGCTDPDKQPRHDAYIILNGVTGHNAKEYIDGIPVFGEPYFNRGTLTAILKNGKSASWEIVIDYQRWTLDYKKIKK